MCRKCPVNAAEVFTNYQPIGVDFGDVGEVRRLLGPDAASLSESEVAHIRDLLLAFADTAFQWWLHRRNARLAESASGVDTGLGREPAAQS